MARVFSRTVLKRLSQYRIIAIFGYDLAKTTKGKLVDLVLGYNYYGLLYKLHLNTETLLYFTKFTVEN